MSESNMPDPNQQPTEGAIPDPIMIGILRKLNGRVSLQRNMAHDALTQAEVQIELLNEQVSALTKRNAAQDERIAELEHQISIYQAAPASVSTNVGSSLGNGRLKRGFETPDTAVGWGVAGEGTTSS